MESRVTEVDKVTREVEVTVAAEEVTRALDEAYVRLNRKVKLQGFRQGKAPRRMLEAMYRHQVEHEVAEDMVQAALVEAAQTHKLQAVGMPRVEGAHVHSGEAFSFKATVQVIPDFELKPLSAERLTKKVVRVTDEEVEEQLGHVAEHFASFETTEDEPLASGDYAVIDLSRIEGGEELKEGSVKGHPIVLGEGSLHPELEGGLIGARRGDVRDLTLGPEQGLAEPRTFRLTVQEAKKRRVPAVDEELARTVGEESLDAVRARLRSEMERLEESRATERLRADLSERLIQLHQVPVPPALLEHAVERLMGDLQRSMAARGHRMDSSQIDADKISDRLRGPAERLARSDLILDKVASERGIEPSEGELQAEVARLARRVEREPSELREELEAQGSLGGLRLDMRRRMTLDALLGEVQLAEELVDRKDVEEKPEE